MLRNIAFLISSIAVAWLVAVFAWLPFRKSHRDFSLWMNNSGLIIGILTWLVLLVVAIKLGWIESHAD